MPRLLLLITITILCLSAADKPKGRKLPDIVIVELKVRRDDGKVMLDGKVRNGGERKLAGVTLTFDFISADKSPVTTQKASLDESLLEPGRESSFHAVTVDPVRAVECVVTGAEDESGRELRLAKRPRFPIE